MKQIEQLVEAAEHSKNPDRIIGLYGRALSICNSHGFRRREAEIYCKRAKYAFKRQKFEDVMQDADESIRIDPDYLEVFLTMIYNHYY